MRNALVYLYSNHSKHHEWNAGLVEPCSSGPWFSGWMHHVERPPDPSPAVPAETWLLERGWHGNWRFIHLGELPRALRESMCEAH